jgi:hypothetical protein
MRRLFALLVLTVVLGTLGLSQTARGDQPDPVPMAMPAATCCPAGRDPAGLVSPNMIHQTRHPLLRHFNPHWWGCGSDQYNPGCDNLKDECIFLFGSCREFYGQPCLQQWHPLVDSHHGGHP